MKLIFIFLLTLFPLIGFALPFNIIPDNSLPNYISPGETVLASYSIINNTGEQRNNNKVTYLPPNVKIDTTASPGACAYPEFNLSKNGSPGSHCTLNLIISGQINSNDSNPHHHLFVCFPDGKTCSGPTKKNALHILSSLTYYTNWIKTLPNFGYKVARGSVFLITNNTCSILLSIFGSCFDNNPAAPYIVPQLPTEGAYVDPYYATDLIQTGPDGLPINMVYRLSDNEALVAIVSYPPKAAYFGYQTYVFTSEIINYPISDPLQIVSPDPNRYEIFGSIGNDVNNTITQNQFGVPWGGKVVVYVTTSNQNIINNLITNAISYQINPNSIFVEPIGSNVLTGNSSTAVDLTTLIRYAVPENNLEGDSWTSQLKNNILIYKISNNKIPVSRYGENQYTARIGTTSELFLQSFVDELSGLLKTYLELNQGVTIDIKKTIASSEDNINNIPTIGIVGSNCINKGTTCLGDNQDSSTYAQGKLSQLAQSDVAFIVGVNHNVPDLNNTTYLSLAISNATIQLGVASSSQTNPIAAGFNNGVLTGSAEGVVQNLGITVSNPSLQAVLPLLYVTFISRDCNNPIIQAANTYCINLMGSSLIPLTNSISITERSYIKPGTTTGGHVNIMVYPSIVAPASDFQKTS